MSSVTRSSPLIVVVSLFSLPSVEFPATTRVPEISTLSLMSIVPPVELRIRLPEVVVTVFSLSLMLSTSRYPLKSTAPSTVKVQQIVVLFDTLKVPPIVVLFDTPKVPPIVVLFDTPKVPPIVVLFDTPKVPPIVVFVQIATIEPIGGHILRLLPDGEVILFDTLMFDTSMVSESKSPFIFTSFENVTGPSN